jgi:hypothetical protein
MYKPQAFPTPTSERHGKNGSEPRFCITNGLYNATAASNKGNKTFETEVLPPRLKGGPNENRCDRGKRERLRLYAA